MNIYLICISVDFQDIILIFQLINLFLIKKKPKNVTATTSASPHEKEPTKLPPPPTKPSPPPTQPSPPPTKPSSQPTEPFPPPTEPSPPPSMKPRASHVSKC